MSTFFCFNVNISEILLTFSLFENVIEFIEHFKLKISYPNLGFQIEIHLFYCLKKLPYSNLKPRMFR